MKTVAFFNKPPSPGELLSNIISQPAKVFAAVTGGTAEVWPSAALGLLFRCLVLCCLIFLETLQHDAPAAKDYQQVECMLE